jgi:hypothetical protein
MTEVKIDQLDEADPTQLYQWYPTQSGPQEALVTLDLDTGELGVRYNPEIGNAVPMSVHHGRTLWWTLPAIPTTAGANQLLDGLLPLAQQVVDGAEIVWDGQNNVGRLDSDASAAAEELADAVAAVSEYDYPMVEPVDAGDWYGSDDHTCVTADTSDGGIEDLAEEHRRQADATSPGGHVVLRGAVEYLTEVRDRLRDEVRAELTEVAEEYRQAKARRDDLVCRAAGWGDSTRAIGQLVGLSHTGVRLLINRT